MLSLALPLYPYMSYFHPVSVSSSCPVPFLFLSYSCPVTVLFLFCSCPVPVLFLSCSWPVPVLFLSCFCPVYVSFLPSSCPLHVPLLSPVPVKYCLFLSYSALYIYSAIYIAVTSPLSCPLDFIQAGADQGLANSLICKQGSEIFQI
jgi:hypothetical protein